MDHNYQSFISDIVLVLKPYYKPSNLMHSLCNILFCKIKITSLIKTLLTSHLTPETPLRNWGNLRTSVLLFSSSSSREALASDTVTPLDRVSVDGFPSVKKKGGIVAQDLRTSLYPFRLQALRSASQS